MSNKVKIVIGVLVAVIVVLIIVMDGSDKGSKVGSISDQMAYESTTTGAYIVTLPTLKTYGGMLGSVVVTGTGAGTLVLYDATTSDVTKRALATSSLRQLASMGSSVAAGTYTFDIAFGLGLTIAQAGAQASTTITFR